MSIEKPNWNKIFDGHSFFHQAKEIPFVDQLIKNFAQMISSGRMPRISTQTHSFSLLPRNPKTNALFQLFVRNMTWIQSGTRASLSQLVISLHHLRNFQFAGIGGGGLAALTFSYVSIASFAEGIHALMTSKKKEEGALKILGGAGAGISAIAALNTTFEAITKIWEHVDLAFLSHIGGVVCAGIGPLVVGALDSITLYRLSRENKKLLIEQSALQKLLTNPPGELTEKEKQTIDEKSLGTLSGPQQLQRLHEVKGALIKNAENRRIQKLKIIGSILFGILQIALAAGTGGLSIGVMLGISVAYLAVSYGIQWYYANKSAARLALT